MTVTIGSEPLRHPSSLMASFTYKKKLIEVALPLEAINRESTRENYIYKGNPSAIHKWWAQRPLATCRAILFASLVDDPSSRPDEFPSEESQDAERQRLFRLVEELVKWESNSSEQLLAAVRAEILRSTKGSPPPVLDPFCGGGSIPLEAIRLGLSAHGSDLNPVPVLVTKALIQFPALFKGRPPVNKASTRQGAFSSAPLGAQGLAEDVRHYGAWMRNEAAKRVGHLYPAATLPAKHGGGTAPVISWLWARTVRCPNPACGARMPLYRSAGLSAKRGRPVWSVADVDRSTSPPKINFRVVETAASPMEAPKTGRGAAFRCLACSQIADEAHIKSEARERRMHYQMLAAVVDTGKRRIYLEPSEVDQWDLTSNEVAMVGEARSGFLAGATPSRLTGGTCYGYGLTTWGSLFTDRQVVALTTLTDLIHEVRDIVLEDARSAGLGSDETRLADGGTGAQAYADAVVTYLAFAIDKTAEYNCTLVPWYAKEDRPKGVFARQALPMVWDFAEVNPFSKIGGSFQKSVEIVTDALAALPTTGAGTAQQADARFAPQAERAVLVSTDPPYYDQIGYADLADFLYVWLRRSLRDVYPALLGTLLTPKDNELVASPTRFDGGKAEAQKYFEKGFRDAFVRMRTLHDSAFPLTIYYAFKQAEADDADEAGGNALGQVSTGWETMLEGLIEAGFLVDGTWPVRTERGSRSVSIGANALASSIVLVCRAREEGAATATRRQFLAELQRELPAALRALQHGNIAPVDLAQAAIGPGIAVFSRYARVLESDGVPMRVRTALALINQVLAETLAEQEGEMDAHTRWALTWFEQYGFTDGPFGDANTLANAKNTSTDGLVDVGIVVSGRGHVRLLRREEMRDTEGAREDMRRTVWEVTHFLIRAIDIGGERAAAVLLGQLGEDGERARDLAYRLYMTCERNGWAQEAQAYNGLVVGWPEIGRLAREVEATGPSVPAQASLSL